MAPVVVRRPLLRRPLTWVLIGVGAVALVVGLALFQPWKLVTDARIDEAAPVAAAPAAAPEDPVAPPAEPVVLARGGLISHEHATTGEVQVLRLPDGTRVLRLEELATSNDPDLKVWITDAPVLPGRDGWGVFDDGRWADLGALKGNLGSSNYALPAEVDLAELSSVSIWCNRFNVSFGAAALQPVA